MGLTGEADVEEPSRCRRRDWQTLWLERSHLSLWPPSPPRFLQEAGALGLSGLLILGFRGRCSVGSGSRWSGRGGRRVPVARGGRTRAPGASAAPDQGPALLVRVPDLPCPGWRGLGGGAFASWRRLLRGGGSRLTRFRRIGDEVEPKGLQKRCQLTDVVLCLVWGMALF